MYEKILIIDFGSQLTQLIARRIREMHVYSKILPYDIDENSILQLDPKGIILSGGPHSATNNYSPCAPNIIFKLGVPILGICYGMQVMTQQLGGNVSLSKIREFGFAEVYKHGNTKLLNNIEDLKLNKLCSVLKVWMSHGDKVNKIPKGFTIIASTKSCPIAGIADDKRNFYGLQFHPEVTHTIQGEAILKRFILNICNIKSTWNVESDLFVNKTIEKIRCQIGNDKVILGLSGGVDSSVVALLLQRAIGNQLICIFVNHGLLRSNESEQVLKIFNSLNIKVLYIDASEIFLHRLTGITDPETKRKIIGHEFIEVFKAEAKKINNTKWLAQGTIYPDVIESGIQKNKNIFSIKSHHNVGGLPKTLNFRLIEPLRELFKDEVKNLGIKLGLPNSIINRHPFPGPGLAVRILGEVKKEFIDLLRQADNIFIKILNEVVELKSGKTWYELVDQAFAVFLPIKSVGIMGDNRTYEYVIVLRAIQTKDFMSAQWAHLPYELLSYISNRIINEVHGINRVTYDISSKPPATIEWE